MEKWKDLKGYEGIYKVSSTGNVVSLDRKIRTGQNFKRTIKGREIKSRLDSLKRYCIIDLSKDGKTITALLHRLIALTFIANPNNYKEVNHIDGNKENNSVSNLEWTTRHLNEIHKYRVLKVKHPFTGRTGKKHSCSKPVLQINPDTNEVINEYESSYFAKGFIQSSISLCCNGKQGLHKGFVWKFKQQ